MSKVNFIADPWEQPAYSRLGVGDPEWMSRYEAFRLRLHWLLLWNSEIQVLDTFTLFNRQFEHWVNRGHAGEGADSQKAKEHLFESGAIRIALRSGGKESFTCLADVDKADVRGNSKFIWYPDGKPHRDFAAKLDTLLGLPRSDNPPWVIGNHQRAMREAFEAGLNPDSSVNREFPIPALPSGEVKALIDLIGNDWRRSRLYEVLGFGISEHGKFRKPLWKHATQNRNAAEQLRKLADSCYHRAINQDLKIAARFPGSNLPLSLDLMYPGTDMSGDRLLGIRPQEAPSLEFRQEMLSRTAICLKGEVGDLFREFGKLSIDRVYKLKHPSGPFGHYYQLHREFQARGGTVWSDAAFAREISNSAFGCLQALGEACHVPIERTPSSKIRLGMHASLLASEYLVTGVAISLSDTVSESLRPIYPLAMLLKIGIHRGIKSAGSKVINRAPERLIHLFARLQRVSPSNPIVATVGCAGDVRTADLEGSAESTSSNAQSPPAPPLGFRA